MSRHRGYGTSGKTGEAARWIRYDRIGVVERRIRTGMRGSDWTGMGESENVIYEKVLFEVDGDWYVEDEAVAVEARAKRIERWGVEPRSGRTFHPTKAFLDKWVRGMYGWKAVKPCDVVITKETCADGIYYHVRKTVGKEDWFIVRSSGKR